MPGRSTTTSCTSCWCASDAPPNDRAGDGSAMRCNPKDNPMTHRPLAFACFLALAPVAQADTLVVHAGQLVDVDRGVVLADQAVRIVDGRIDSVAPWTDA